MTPVRVKSLLDDVNEISSLLKPVAKEGYDMESAESMLEEEKHDMIRNFIISSHLLSELFMTLRMISTSGVE